MAGGRSDYAGEAGAESKDAKQEIELKGLEYVPSHVARLIVKNIEIESPIKALRGSDIVAAKNKYRHAVATVAPYFDRLLNKSDLIALTQLEASGAGYDPAAQTLKYKAFKHQLYAWMMTHPDEQAQLSSFLATKKKNQKAISQEEKKLSALNVLELEGSSESSQLVKSALKVLELIGVWTNP